MICRSETWILKFDRFSGARLRIILGPLMSIVLKQDDVLYLEELHWNRRKKIS